MSRRPAARRAVARRAARPPARRVWGALIVALGLILAQGPMLLHLLLVRHVACEHGELVELVELARSAAAPASPEAEVIRESDAPARLEATEAGGSDHAHCDVLAVRHRPGDVTPAFGAASLLSIALPARLCPPGETRPVPLLALAPKSSPPRA